MGSRHVTTSRAHGNQPIQWYRVRWSIHLPITLSLCLHFHVMAIGVAIAFSPFEPFVAISAAPLSNFIVSSRMYTKATCTSLELCLFLHHHQLSGPCSPCCLHNVHVCPLSTSTPSLTCMWPALASLAPLATYMTRACFLIPPNSPCLLQPLSVPVGLLALRVSLLTSPTLAFYLHCLMCACLCGHLAPFVPCDPIAFQMASNSSKG